MVMSKIYNTMTYRMSLVLSLMAVNGCFAASERSDVGSAGVYT